MKNGIILITIDDNKSSPGWDKERMPNPYRTGGFFVIKKEAASRVFDNFSKDIKEFALSQRWIFIEHEAAKIMGLFNFEKSERTAWR